MNSKEITKKIAYKEAVRRNDLARKGFFDNPHATRTANIEQEVQILDSSIQRAGMPVDVSEFFHENSISARPDTSTFIVEYDGSSDPVEITDDGLGNLTNSFIKRTHYVQDKIPKGAIIVPIGTNPVLKASESETWLVKDEPKYHRYLHIDANAYSENLIKKTNIKNPSTGVAVCERASSIKGMFRATGTQFHISEKSIAGVLDSHRTSISIAPFMVAAFGNSPFLAGIDTGMSSSRMELLCQTEQLRSGLPKPANSLLEYYEEILSHESPFICVDNSSNALDLALSAIHTVSRIRVAINKNSGTIRNEFRHIDSQSPYKSMQAFLLTLGSIEAFRYSKERPKYEESWSDFQNSVWGLKTDMHWNGQLMSAKSLGLYIVDKAVKALDKINLDSMAHEYLDPLKEELDKGISQSDKIRNIFYRFINQGTSFNEALNEAIKSLNAEALSHI